MDIQLDLKKENGRVREIYQESVVALHMSEVVVVLKCALKFFNTPSFKRWNPILLSLGQLALMTL